MPLYEYQCDACGKRFEVIQKFSDPPVETCAKCGQGPVHKQLSSPAIQFKGTGWYITDYAQKGKSGGVPSGDSAKSETKTEGGGGDSAKTESTGTSTSSPATPATPTPSKS